MTYRLPKLELSPIWPALAAVVVAALVLWTVLPDLVEETAAEQLLDTLEILTPVLSAQAAGGPDDLQARISSLAQGGDLRLTLVASDGTVLADSERTAAQVLRMDNHLDRPEIAEALATGSGSSVRWSATIGIHYAYAARTVTARDGRLYVVRMAQPLRALATLQRRLTTGLVLALSAGLAAAALVFFWISRRLIQPIARLAAGAGALAAGDYSQRLEAPEERHLALLADSLNRMTERVEEQIAAVRSERDHLEAIVRSMSDGVLVTDRQGRAQLVNPEFGRLFGVDRLDRLGGDPRGRLPLEIARRPELAELIEATLARGESFHVTVELRQPERRVLALTSAALAAPRTASPAGTGAAVRAGELAEPSERPHGAVVVARDVTRTIRIDEMRRDFVANVSHELKTPLSAIRGYAETLRDGALDDPPAARRFTERTLQQCRRLQSLLDDLLTLSRLESPERELTPEPVDLGATARRAVETVHEGAAGRGISVRVEPPPEDEAELPTVPGDREGLERMLLNLLENGVKYNQKGGTVVVTLGRVADEAVIEVTDTGIGIAQDDQDRIFERFYRVDKGRARAFDRAEGQDQGGTGLGLAIVKHIVQSHGGRIEVESELGVGTTFRVHLPLRGTAG